MFYTQFNRPPVKRETNDGQLITESAGYRPAQKIIEDMIYSGQRLQQARAEEYDFNEKNKLDTNFYDPTREPDFDVFDAQDLAKDVSERLSEQESKAKVEESKPEEKADDSQETESPEDKA